MNREGDALSDVLRLVQLKACIYFIQDMKPPWGLSMPRSAHGPLHMVLRGGCVLRHSQQDIALQAGDAILLPRGAKHQMIDQPSTVAEPASVVMARTREAESRNAPPDATRMLCGHFERIVDLIGAESIDHEPGGSAIADRLGEVAKMAGMSRTAFAVRFREVMGTPPASYQSDWRLLNARRLLQRSDLPMSEIVMRLGYASDSTFVRAYKRRFGQTPGKSRRTQGRSTSSPA